MNEYCDTITGKHEIGDITRFDGSHGACFVMPTDMAILLKIGDNIDMRELPPSAEIRRYADHALHTFKEAFPKSKEMTQLAADLAKAPFTALTAVEGIDIDE